MCNQIKAPCSVASGFQCIIKLTIYSLNTVNVDIFAQVNFRASIPRRHIRVV